MKEKINEKLDKFYEHTWISVFVTFLVMLTIFKLTGKLFDSTMATYGAAMTTTAVPEDTLARVPREFQAIYPAIMVMAVCSIGAIELSYGLFLLRKSKWEEIKAYFAK